MTAKKEVPKNSSGTPRNKDMNITRLETKDFL